MKLFNFSFVAFLLLLGLGSPTLAGNNPGHQLIYGPDAIKFLQLFSDSKVPQVKVDENLNGYFILDQVLCETDTRDNLNPNDVLYKIPTYSCTATSEGKPLVLSEARKLYELMSNFVEDEDCVGDKCSIKFKEIACVIQPEKQAPLERFICVLVTE